MANPDAPTLEMLWEPTDPAVVLADRFGFSTAGSAARWVADTVEGHWDVEVLTCERIVLSFKNALAWVRTPSGRMLAKWSIARHRFARLAELAELTGWLDERDLPVSALATTRDGHHQLEVDEISMSLQREISGTLLDTSDPVQVHAAGAMLARLHEALATYPFGDRIRERTGTDSRPLRARLESWPDDDTKHLPCGLRDALHRMVRDLPTKSLPDQLVHGDYRSANILWSNDEITAVLDFEETEPDHRIVDLARAAVLLGTRFHDWGPVTPDVRARFVDGYQAVRPLTDVEAAWWDPLVLWFSLAMIPPGDDPTGWAAAAAAQLRRR